LNLLIERYKVAHIMRERSLNFAIMMTLVIYKKQIFIERTILSIPEIIIGIGFVLILLFNIVSILWLLRKFRKVGKVTTSKKITLALGSLCLLLR